MTTYTLVINDYIRYVHNSGKMRNKEITNFVRRTERKFENYFIAYGVRKQKDSYYISVIIDDRDVFKMSKEELRKKINSILNSFIKSSKEKIVPKTIFVSELIEENIWKVLGDYAGIYDVKAFSSFSNIRFHPHFFKVFKKLPQKFKLSDFARELSKLSDKTYHRNTYQNWLKLLKNAGFIRLKNRTYYKVGSPYKDKLFEMFKKDI